MLGQPVREAATVDVPMRDTARHEAAGYGATTQDLMGRPEPGVYDGIGRRAASERTTAERTAVGTVPTNIYRARRPAVAAMLVIPAPAFGLLMVRALAIAAFGKTFVLGGVIASSLLLAALPMLVLGLYGLITGASHGAEQWGFRVWARPPLAYLLVGLALAATAALAVA